MAGVSCAIAATSITANSSSKKSDTPPVIWVRAASMATGSAECRIVEMATTVEILISMGSVVFGIKREWLALRSCILL